MSLLAKKNNSKRSNSFSHILLTRFNAKFAAKWTDICLDPNWLDHRFDLFDKFCYPSVLSQTTENFKWLIFLHEKTPKKYQDRINKIAKWHVIKPVFNDFLSRDVIMNEIYSLVKSKKTHIITSTLDNDDAISRNFIEETQNQFAFQQYKYINWAIGYIYREGRFYFRKDLQSPFNSLIAHISEDKFVWDVWHNKILETGDVIQITKNPGWIQVVHEKNVSNRIRGWRISAPEITDYFTISKNIIFNKESLILLFFDKYFFCPLRYLRDLIIIILKKFIDIQHIAILLGFRK